MPSRARETTRRWKYDWLNSSEEIRYKNYEEKVEQEVNKLSVPERKDPDKVREIRREAKQWADKRVDRAQGRRQKIL